MFNLNNIIKRLLATIYKGKVLHQRQNELFAKTGELLGFVSATFYFYDQTKKLYCYYV
jgi:hypothetical protein